jgi:hypothetical protein
LLPLPVLERAAFFYARNDVLILKRAHNIVKYAMILYFCPAAEAEGAMGERLKPAVC